MKDLLCAQFQDVVANYLVRHKSILDVLSKLQEASARVNRATTKAVTNCGCVQIKASRQELPGQIALEDWREHMQTHIIGELCGDCREVIEDEIGRSLFYLAALCSTLEIDMFDSLIKEFDRLETLRLYNLS